MVVGASKGGIFYFLLILNTYMRVNSPLFVESGGLLVVSVVVRLSKFRLVPLIICLSQLLVSPVLRHLKSVELFLLVEASLWTTIAILVFVRRRLNYAGRFN